MDLYLPIAELSVNALVIVALGGLVGFMSGLFGVGGGFLTTPLLIFYGIPPAVAVASSAPQVTGSSFAGALAHWRRGGVDPKMGLVMVAGGILGALLGSQIFRQLQQVGQIDVVISVVYVLLLGGIGTLMLSESVRTITRARRARPRPSSMRRHHPLVMILPFRMRFYKAGLYISPLAPFLLGLTVGVLTVIMGVGGGFIMVPAMIYLIGMQASVVIGTSLFQIVFVTAATTLLHSVHTKAVDIVLAALLLVGGTIGAQFGAGAAQKLPGEKLRLLLGLIVLSVALRLLVGLSVRPPELYSVFADT
jgi:uncharacterized membrane protein YfcA